MKRTALVLLFLVSILMGHAADELLVFGTNHFDGWLYTRSGVEITNQNISQDNINLYGDYTLISPEVTVSYVSSITVNVTGRTNGYEQSAFSNPKVWVQLLDENGVLLKEKKHSFTTKEREHNFEVEFDVTDIADAPFKLRFACWDASIPSHFSVRKVKVTAKGYIGDVNNDGTVTSADITALYDFLLNDDSSHIVNGDINEDGDITSADITAVYSILLGED